VNAYPPSNDFVQIPQTQFQRIDGYAGIADNERCDVLAMAACKMRDLPPDPGYVEEISEEPTTEEPLVRVTPQGSRKITAEGQPCRHCGTPVVKRVPRHRKVKEGQTYYFAWYLFCPNCKAMYLVEEAKQGVGGNEDRQEEVKGNQ
jgi:ribonuclease HI